MGPVLHSAKVWFDFLPFLSAPSLQELIPELPQAQPEQHSHTRLGEKKGKWDILASALEQNSRIYKLTSPSFEVSV